MKVYDKEQFLENDLKAREAFKAIAKETRVIEGAEFEVDLICIREDLSVYFVDVEVSSLTFSDKDSFKYGTVNFLAKKKKYLELGEFYYILFSKDFRSYIIGTFEIFNDLFLVENLPCIDRKGARYFEDVYSVPKKQLKFMTYED